MTGTDKQDALVKGSIVLLGIFVFVVLLLEWYHEAFVIALSGLLCWVTARKVKTRRNLAVVAVAALGLASTVGINRLVTHQLVVENKSGGVISNLLVRCSLTFGYSTAFHVQSPPVGKRYDVKFRSMFFDGGLQVGFTLPDGSRSGGDTRELEEEYRGKSHVIIHKDGKVEIHRR